MRIFCGRLIGIKFPLFRFTESEVLNTVMKRNNDENGKELKEKKRNMSVRGKKEMERRKERDAKEVGKERREE